MKKLIVVLIVILPNFLFAHVIYDMDLSKAVYCQLESKDPSCSGFSDNFEIICSDINGDIIIDEEHNEPEDKIAPVSVLAIMKKNGFSPVLLKTQDNMCSLNGIFSRL